MDKKNNDSPGTPETPIRRRIQKTSLYFLLFVLILASASFFYITRFFFIPVILALSFSVLFSPFYNWLLKKLGNRRNLAALLSVLTLFLGFVLPLLFIMYLLFNQVVRLIGVLQSQNFFEESTMRNILQWLEKTRLNQWLQIFNINWQAALRDGLGDAVGFLTDIINRTARGVINLIINLFLLLVTLFYFFRDGNLIRERVLYLVPLSDDYEQLLITRFVSITRATLIGTVVIGFIQGLIGAIALLIFGIPAWYLWGIIIVILAFIPVLGPGLILIPAGIVLIIDGQLVQGIILFLVTFLVVNLIDNLLRPRLVGHSARMHDLLILFSTLGGIAVFGIIGFVIGPVIAAFFITFLSIYGLEYQNALSVQHAHNDNSHPL